MKKGKSAPEIADELEENVDIVQKICNVAKDFGPEYKANQIYQRIKNS